MKKPSNFALGAVATLIVAVAMVSGYLSYYSVGFAPLVVFVLKSLLLGLATGVVAKGSDLEKYGHPVGLWFMSGFGIVMAVFSVLLIAQYLAVTALCAYVFGFFFVYSEAANEMFGDPRDLVEDFAVYLIIGSLVITGLFVLGFGPLILSYIHLILP